MCGLFITNDESTISILQQYNSKRGGVRSTLEQVYSSDENEKVKIYIGHHQAPTSTTTNSHPSVLEFTGNIITSKLWHNGIVKDDCIKQLQLKYNDNTEWDTQLIHKDIAISDEGYTNLSNIDGSFALVHFLQTEDDESNSGVITVMRNLLAPLFCNDDHTIISSAKVPELNVINKVPPHEVILYNPVHGLLDTSIKFKTCNNPYDIS